eukprot:scaffold104899_cov39-Tisochrysis_lutea.AAC.2
MESATSRRIYPLVSSLARGSHPFPYCDIRAPGNPVGMAAFFETYSTWEGKCLFLEDLFISASARGKGAGTALLRAVAAVAKERHAARLQWQALDWNDRAITFYQSSAVRNTHTRLWSPISRATL